jgi:predicted kinase
MLKISDKREKEDAEREAKRLANKAKKEELGKNDFGRKTRKTKKFNKLIKLCKKYKVKIGKKSFSKLRTDCMKKIKMLLKNV